MFTARKLKGHSGIHGQIYKFTHKPTQEKDHQQRLSLYSPKKVQFTQIHLSSTEGW